MSKFRHEYSVLSSDDDGLNAEGVNENKGGFLATASMLVAGKRAGSSSNSSGGGSKIRNYHPTVNDIDGSGTNLEMHSLGMSNITQTNSPRYELLTEDMERDMNLFQTTNNPSNHQPSNLPFSPPLLSTPIGVDNNNNNNKTFPSKSTRGNKYYAIPNLDGFFTQVYRFFEGKGFYNIMLSRILNLITLAFVVCFSVFLLSCVDYTELFTSFDLAKAVSLSKLSSLHPTLIICFVVFSIFWVFQFVRVFTAIPSLLDMKYFYNQELNIPDSEIETIQWAEIMKRLRAAQKRIRISVITEDLTAHDVVNRIMRKENYLIGMFNKDIFDISIKTPFFGKTIFLPKSLEWNLYKCVVDFAFDPKKLSISDKILYHDRPDELAKKLRVKLRFFGILNFIFSPFILLFLVAYFFFRYAEEFQSRPNLLGIRQWTPYARWWMREFNELPHVLQRRLANGYKPAVDYVSKFNSELVTLLARFVTFIAGSFVAVITVLSLYDEQFLLDVHVAGGRSMLWILGLFGIVLAVSRSLIPDDNLVFDPVMLMKNIVYHTHMFPATWKGREHTYEVLNEFGHLFNLKIFIFLQEVVSVFVTPYILFFKLPNSARGIVDFYREYTKFDDAVGHVCDLALFDFKKYGNPKYGAPVDAETTAQPQTVTENGKMEKSFLSFKASYADWEPNAAGKEYLEKLSRYVRPAQSLVPQPRGLYNSHILNIGTKSVFAVSSPDISPDAHKHGGIGSVMSSNNDDTLSDNDSDSGSDIGNGIDHDNDNDIDHGTDNDVSSRNIESDITKSKTTTTTTTTTTEKPNATVINMLPNSSVAASQIPRFNTLPNRPVVRFQLPLSTLVASQNNSVHNSASSLARSPERTVVQQHPLESSFTEFLTGSDYENMPATVYENLGLSALLLEHIFDANVLQN